MIIFCDLGFSGGSDSKDYLWWKEIQIWSILGRSPGEENGNPFQYSCLENSKDRGAWQVTVHGVAKSRNDWVTNSSHFLWFATSWSLTIWFYVCGVGSGVEGMRCCEPITQHGNSRLHRPTYSWSQYLVKIFCDNMSIQGLPRRH